MKMVAVALREGRKLENMFRCGNAAGDQAKENHEFFQAFFLLAGTEERNEKAQCPLLVQ
jgi:hypothetical protein